MINIFVFIKHVLLLFIDAVTIAVANRKWINISHNNINKTIAFIRLDAIGDFMIILPYLKGIKKYYHDNDNFLILIGNKLWRELGEYFLTDMFNRFIWIDKTKYKNNIFYRIKMNLNLSRISADKVIDSTYYRDYIYNDSVVRSISADIKIGWTGGSVGMYPVLSRLSQKSYTELLDSVELPLEADKLHYFFNHILKMDIDSSYRIDSKVGEKSKYGLPKNYCVIVPGASWSGREWESYKSAECADYIDQKYNRTIVLVGSIEEQYKYDEIKRIAKTNNIINCIGKTNLLDMIEIIRNADLLITNETSAIHMASLTNTKTICVFGGGHFGRFVPNYNKINIKWVYKKMECFGCNWKCIYDIENGHTMPCISNIKSTEIFGMIDELLQ